LHYEQTQNKYKQTDLIITLHYNLLLLSCLHTTEITIKLF